MISIREAKEQDIDMIYSCIRGLAEHVNQLELVTAKKENLLLEIFSPNSHVLVLIAENEKNEVTGFSLFFKTFSTFKAKTNIFIEDLFVFPEFRGKGIGKMLLDRICEYAKSIGAAKVEWYVNNLNKGAINFYNNYGAKQLDYKSIFYREV